MDEKKVAFIICSNNDLWYEECEWYIYQLKLPEGFTIDVIKITGAESICEAYNAAMESSDAKYKVYLHQDVFIYHREFIEDIVRIFRTDESLGMLGMIGMVDLPKNAVIWDSWDMGSTYASDRNKAFCLKWKQEEDKLFSYANAVDGMLMATQYDVKWRKDLELGWDFYDISQSLEFQRNGYRVGIPTQREPWCMHDCGYSKLEQYDLVREKIIREYADYFTDVYVPVHNEELQALKEQVFGQVKLYIENGETEKAYQIRDMMSKSVDNRIIRHNGLQYAVNILDVLKEEQKSTAEGYFTNLKTWDELVHHYTKIAFLTRHLERGTNPAGTDELNKLFDENKIAREAVWSIAKHSVVDLESARKKIIRGGKSC